MNKFAKHAAERKDILLRPTAKGAADDTCLYMPAVVDGDEGADETRLCFCHGSQACLSLSLAPASCHELERSEAAHRLVGGDCRPVIGWCGHRGGDDV